MLQRLSSYITQALALRPSLPRILELDSIQSLNLLSQKLCGTLPGKSACAPGSFIYLIRRIFIIISVLFTA